LITTATNTAFDSLQYLHSAGAWDPSGKRFALATVREGHPVLTLLDVDGGQAARDLRFDQFDEIYSPTWSPVGDAIAFAALGGGATDLFIVDLKSEHVRRLTHDQFADVQPAWSPDGHSIAFATDRFTTKLSELKWGSLQIALMELRTGVVSPLGGDEVASQRDPAWSPDGKNVFFVGDRGDITNIFRFDRDSGSVFQITDIYTGVSGVTRLSPALSIAGASELLPTARLSVADTQSTPFNPARSSMANRSQLSCGVPLRPLVESTRTSLCRNFLRSSIRAPPPLTENIARGWGSRRWACRISPLVAARSARRFRVAPRFFSVICSAIVNCSLPST
jgi:WD40 repeat protein